MKRVRLAPANRRVFLSFLFRCLASLVNPAQHHSPLCPRNTRQVSGFAFQCLFCQSGEGERFNPVWRDTGRVS
jgi:hypothetical protein